MQFVSSGTKFVTCRGFCAIGKFYLGEGELGKVGEESQKVKIPSYKINKSWDVTWGLQLVILCCVLESCQERA